MSLHRFLRPAKHEVDHINNNPLDNRKVNLRSTNHSQNGRNRRRVGEGFKGVYRSTDKTWIVRVWSGETNINIGSFDDELLAAHIYNEVIGQIFGRQAVFMKQNTV